MIDLHHAAAPAFAAFLASAVEFVEALTVVLAVGGVRGWRDTLAGAAAAVGLLAALTAALGPALTLVPLRPLQVVVGALLPAVRLALAAQGYFARRRRARAAR